MLGWPDVLSLGSNRCEAEALAHADSSAGVCLASHPSRVQVLMQRFEGLLDRILRSKSYAGSRGASGSSGGPSGGGGSRGGSIDRELTLPVRSLATSFWALGNMSYPLSSEQLDKIAGGWVGGWAGGWVGKWLEVDFAAGLAAVLVGRPSLHSMHAP